MMHHRNLGRSQGKYSTQLCLFCIYASLPDKSCIVHLTQYVKLYLTLSYDIAILLQWVIADFVDFTNLISRFNVITCIQNGLFDNSAQSVHNQCNIP